MQKISSFFSGVLGFFKKIFITIRREHLFKVIGITFLVLSLCSAGIYYFEHKAIYASIRTIGDAFWWAIVTITTVGYGDKVPHTLPGKFVGMILMFSGIGLLSIVTATIASFFVQEKIKEGRGLETIKDKDHIVICGWNSNAEKAIKVFALDEHTKKNAIVIVNELSMDKIDSLRSRYEKYNFKFIRGDFIHEDVLKRANIKNAKYAIVFADTSGDHSLQKADERTALGTLAIKTIAPNVRTCAELLSIENKQHLKRANVDEIIVRDEHVGELLASATVHTGLYKVISSLLSYDNGNKLEKFEIPNRFIGKRYGELGQFLREKHRSILIGILTEKQGLQLEDILSDDVSAIDMFIKKKFEEADKDYFPEKEELGVNINPEDDYIITKNDFAIVIGSKK
ncbi:MAG: ion channel [Pseudomonadota bacterium]